MHNSSGNTSVCNYLSGIGNSCVSVSVAGVKSLPGSRSDLKVQTKSSTTSSRCWPCVELHKHVKHCKLFDSVSSAFNRQGVPGVDDSTGWFAVAAGLRKAAKRRRANASVCRQKEQKRVLQCGRWIPVGGLLLLPGPRHARSVGKSINSAYFGDSW